VQQGATHDDIRSAYRKQMQLYHPDRVEHLGSELKRTAHDQALLIQRALDELLPK
jgi:DnaJ-class molecular chaperone